MFFVVGVNGDAASAGLWDEEDAKLFPEEGKVSAFVLLVLATRRINGVPSVLVREGKEWQLAPRTLRWSGRPGRERIPISACKRGRSGSSHFGRSFGEEVQVAKGSPSVLAKRGRSGNSHFGRSVGKEVQVATGTS